MQRLGFIHDMMDVKVLILFVMARASYPMTTQEIYEICYQDECLSYFDVCTAIPEMVQSGHLLALPDEKYEITEKGRRNEELTADSIAFSVKQRAENAIARFNRQIRRSSLVSTEIISSEKEECTVAMSLSDEMGSLMTLHLTAPDRRQALRLSKLFEQKAEDVYSLVMTELLDGEDEI